MEKDKIGVGIVGLQPGRSWAWRAHVPALRALSDSYAIEAVANTSLESAESAASQSDIPNAYGRAEELIAAPEVDLVVVAVKVAHHHEIVSAAIEAGKHVYCEWPLGNGLAEARDLAERARAKGVICAIGTQACSSPEIAYVRDLVAEGYVGEILSTTLIGTGMNWGPKIEEANAYTLERRNGANMLTVPLGHSLAAVTKVVGGVDALSAMLMTRRREVLVVDTGEIRPMTAPDQVLVNAILDNGAPLSIHYRGGMPKGTGLLWEINGTAGDLQITGMGGHMQFVDLKVSGAKSEDEAMRPLATPQRYLEGFAVEGHANNVARMYRMLASDILRGTSIVPNFDDAVKIHKIIDAIERAAESGMRTEVA